MRIGLRNPVSMQSQSGVLVAPKFEYQIFPLILLFLSFVADNLITQSPSMTRKSFYDNISAIVDFPLPQVPVRTIMFPPLHLWLILTSAPQSLQVGRIGDMLKFCLRR